MVESTEHDSKKHDYWSKDKYFLQVTLRSTLKYLIAPPFSITPTVDRTQLQGRSTNPYIFTHLHNLDAVHEKFIKILMLVHKISKNNFANLRTAIRVPNSKNLFPQFFDPSGCRKRVFYNPHSDWVTYYDKLVFRIT